MKQIVIADTSKENLLKARLILENGSIIFPARTKNWMMKVLKQKNIDLIILNVNVVGNNDTLQLLEKIRSSERYKSVPFIIAATDSEEDIITVRKCIEKGNVQAVSTPYDKDELTHFVYEM